MGVLNAILKKAEYRAFANYTSECANTKAAEDAALLFLEFSENEAHETTAEWRYTTSFAERGKDDLQDAKAILETPFLLQGEQTPAEMTEKFTDYLTRYHKHGLAKWFLQNPAYVYMGYAQSKVQCVFENSAFAYNRPSYFNYHVEPTTQNLRELEASAATALDKLFHFTSIENSAHMVEEITCIVEKVQSGKPLHSDYEKVSLLAFDLASLFAETLIHDKNWSWLLLGTDENSLKPMVVSPDESYVIPVHDYFYTLLLDEKAAATLPSVQTLWKRAKNPKHRIESKKHVPLLDVLSK